MRIDVHAHHLVPEYFAFLDAIPASAGFPRTPAALAVPVAVDLDERARMLDAAGVDVQILSLGPAMPYLPREADGVKGARIANDAFAAVTRRPGGRFGAFGAVPLPHVDAAIAEAARCLDLLGMLGIALSCTIGERMLDDPAFEPFWAELSRREAVVFLHPTFREVDPMLSGHDLVTMVGAIFEDSVAALRLVQSGLTERHAGIRFIVPHLGGMLPFVWARLERRGKDELLRRLRRLYYDSTNGYGPALRCGCEALGADRLMLGSDFPMIRAFDRAVAYVREALDPDDAEAVLDRTAAALFGPRLLRGTPLPGGSGPGET